MKQRRDTDRESSRAPKTNATPMNAKAARRRACKRVRRYISRSESLSEELMAERKQEAEREQAGYP